MARPANRAAPFEFDRHAGGSFAPPLDARTLERYYDLALTAEPEVRDAVRKLCETANAYLSVKNDPAHEGKVPAPVRYHPSGYGEIRALPGAAVLALDPHVPYPRELEYLKGLFETIPADAQGALRDAAHHLLWYAAELCLDRHPITTDTL